MKSILLTLAGIIAFATLAQAQDPFEPPISALVPSNGWLTYEALPNSDKELLRKGEISQPQLLAGGFLGTFLGFGTGHIPYEMYSTRGWIFTVGEAGALLLAILGASGQNNDCTVLSNGTRICDDVKGSDLALATGLLTFIGLRIWEIIDVWTIPSKRNYEIRRVRQKMGRELTKPEWSIYPTHNGSQGRKSSSTGIEFSYRF